MSRFEEVVNDVIGEVILGETGFKAEQLAQRVAERVRERQDALRAEVTIAARYPEYKPAPVSGNPRRRRSTRSTARRSRASAARAGSSASPPRA